MCEAAVCKPPPPHCFDRDAHVQECAPTKLRGLAEHGRDCNVITSGYRVYNLALRVIQRGRLQHLHAVLEERPWDP
eukprot:6818946-Pyramimonas_sp.AAC.1